MSEENMALKLLEFFEEYHFQNELSEDDLTEYEKIKNHFSRKHHLYEYSKERLKEKEEHFKRSKNFYCPYCSKKKYSFYGLTDHLKTNHKEEINSYNRNFPKKDRFSDEIIFAVSKDGEENRMKFLVDKCFTYLQNTIKITSEKFKENSVSRYFLSSQEDEYIQNDFKKDDVRKLTLEELEELSELMNEEDKLIQNDSSRYWSDSSGVKFNYKNMSDRHIENSLRKLFRDNVEDVFVQEVEALTKQKKSRIERGAWNPTGNFGMATVKYLQYCKVFEKSP